MLNNLFPSQFYSSCTCAPLRGGPVDLILCLLPRGFQSCFLSSQQLSLTSFITFHEVFCARSGFSWIIKTFQGLIDELKKKLLL